MSNLKLANDLFIQGKFAQALALYLDLNRKDPMKKYLDVNIALCRSRLSRADSLPKLGDCLTKAGVSRCYVMNLTHRTDRKIRTILEFNKHGIVPTFIDAVDANLSIESERLLVKYQKIDAGMCIYAKHISLENQKFQKTKLNKACFAYLLSIKKILEDAISNNYKKICIFDDDVFFTDFASSHFNELINLIGMKWKVILLGASEYSDVLNSDFSSVYYHPVPGKTCGTFGGVYDSDIFSEILRAINAAAGTFDNVIMGHIYSKYNNECFVINPNVCIPDITDSNIREQARDQQVQAEKMRWDISNFEAYKAPIPIAVIVSNINSLKYINSFGKSISDFEISCYCLTKSGLVKVKKDVLPQDAVILPQSIFFEDPNKQVDWIMDNLKDLNHAYYMMFSYCTMEITESSLRFHLLSCLQKEGYSYEKSPFYECVTISKSMFTKSAITCQLTSNEILEDKIKIVIGVTTYNRKEYLKSFIDSWNNTRNREYDYTLIISDDGSDDGTIEYLEKLHIADVKVHIIKHCRTGVHESTNSILHRCLLTEFDYGFKCDDDVLFKKAGWDDAYIQGMKKYPYMCNYNVGWRKSKPVGYDDGFIAYSNAYYSQGAFWTFTKKVLKVLGWFDTKTFGYKGYGHIDYSIRACRAGFNKFDTFFDIVDSSNYVTLQLEEYKPAMTLEQVEKDFSLVIDENIKEQMKVKILEERSDIIYVGRNSIYKFPLCDKKPTVYFFIINNHIGGAENVHFAHALALKKLGFNVKVFSVTKGQTYERFVSNNFEIVHIPSLFDSIENFRCYVAEISDGSYIYDCNTWRPDFFSELSKVKFIYYFSIIHSDIDNTVNNCLKSLDFTYRYICIHDGIVRKLYEKNVPRDIVKLVPNTLDNEFQFGYRKNVDAALRNKFKIPEQDLVIAVVGRIAKDKNILAALELFQILRKKGFDIVLIIIGGESLRNADKGYFKEFENKLNEIKDSKLIYLGEQKSNEINELLNVVDVGINVSPSEGLPISMLEQLAMGVYCVYPSFQGICSVLQNFPSKVINILQRSSNSLNAKYTPEEIGLFVEQIANLNRVDLLPLKDKISDIAAELFSFSKLYTNISEAF